METSKIIFWIATVILAMAFVVWCILMFILNKRRTNIKVPIACAGTGHDKLPRDVSMIKEFIENLAQKSMIPFNSNLKPYFIKGNSMQYAKIFNDSIVLAEKSNGVIDESELPKVIVLRISDARENECQFKLRRAWKVITHDTTTANFEHEVLEVVSSSEFQELRNRIGEHCPSDESLMASALEKFNRRRTEGSQETYILSTTYRTERKMVDFSLHRLSSLAGVARYAASPNNAKG